TGQLVSTTPVATTGVLGFDTASAAPRNFGAYTGTRIHGIDYSPTWLGWVPTKFTQFEDSDFLNDAFASFVAANFQSPPTGAQSTPQMNALSRTDLQTIFNDGFNLIRPYNWGQQRGWSGGQSGPGPGLAHINFLTTAANLRLKVVVPVSDYFLGNDTF